MLLLKENICIYLTKMSGAEHPGQDVKRECVRSCCHGLDSQKKRGAAA